MKNNAQCGCGDGKLKILKLLSLGGLYLERKKKKECYVGFPVLTQLSSASGRKVRTTAFLKGAKQPPAFPKNPPKLLHKKKAIYSGTRRWIMSVEIYCYKKLGFFFLTLSSYTTNTLRKAAFGKYKLHTRTMVERS